jgi:hypothetical protein
VIVAVPTPSAAFFLPGFYSTENSEEPIDPNIRPKGANARGLKVYKGIA